MKNKFNNNDLNNDTEKHLRADEIRFDKWVDDQNQHYDIFYLSVNDDSYFYANESDRDFDFANAKRLFTKK